MDPFPYPAHYNHIPANNLLQEIDFQAWSLIFDIFGCQKRDSSLCFLWYVLTLIINPFNLLFSPVLDRKNLRSRFREPIPPEERLALMFRYLATENSQARKQNYLVVTRKYIKNLQVSLSFNFLGRQLQIQS